MATFAVINNGSGSIVRFGTFAGYAPTGTLSVIPVPITVTELTLAAPMTNGNSVTISMQVNGIDIPPPLTITYPTNHASITGLTDAYSAGEFVSQSLAASLNPGKIAHFATTYQPSSPYQNLCLLPSFVAGSTIPASASSPQYLSIDGQTFLSESQAQTLWPVNGTLQAWAVQYLTVSGQTTTFTLALRKNGVSVWALTLPPNSPNATTVIDTVNTVPVAAGDLINYVLTVPSGSASITIKSLILGFHV